ncbi:MAG: GNAT family N-acetyltransferase [Clostridiales bacterium]|nr:MAG: GNAT family N-acetyltransferase [Clostridiales bacterium]
MRFEEKKIVLSDGREAELRSPITSDALKVINFFEKCCGETNYLLRYPEEVDYTEEEERDILDDYMKSEDKVMLACFIDEKLAGISSIVFNHKIKTKHRASISIALLKKYWGLSIGSQMIGELIDLAKKRGVLQMELDYIEGNERAKALYEKMGFVEVGVKPNSIRLKNGKLLSEISMIRTL